MPPKPSTGDTVYLVADSVLSFIPGAPELFRKFVTPPLEKRQFAWMQEVSEVIEELLSSKGLTLDELRNNDAFVSVVIQATYVAIRNHREEKMRSLANCVLNAGNGANIENDLQLAFVRYVDELSPSHMVLLRTIRDRYSDIKSLKSYESLYQLLCSSFTPSLTRDVFKMMCLELQGHGLIDISQYIENFVGLYEAKVFITEDTEDGLPRIAISEVGKQFLAFISTDY